jgi:acyl carrier protein
MTVTERVQRIIDNIILRKSTAEDLNKTWEELDIDSLDLVEVLRDVEDEFVITLEYSIFKDNKILTVTDLINYLNKQQP